MYVSIVKVKEKGEQEEPDGTQAGIGKCNEDKTALKRSVSESF